MSLRRTKIAIITWAGSIEFPQAWTHCSLLYRSTKISTERCKWHSFNDKCFYHRAILCWAWKKLIVQFLWVLPRPPWRRTSKGSNIFVYNCILSYMYNRAASRQNQQCGCAPSEDSDQPGHPPSLIRVFAVRSRVAKDPSFLHANSEDFDKTGRMSRLIWVFAGRTVTLLVFLWSGSIINTISLRKVSCFSARLLLYNES